MVDGHKSSTGNVVDYVFPNLCQSLSAGKGLQFRVGTAERLKAVATTKASFGLVLVTVPTGRCRFQHLAHPGRAQRHFDLQQGR